MDENRLEGNVRNVSGKVQEGVGRTTGDTKSKVEGVMNQVAGAAQDLYGQGADFVRENGKPLEAWLRTYSRARNRLAARQNASAAVVPACSA